MINFDKNIKILEGEAVEPLDADHSIIQPTHGYRFGEDAVALAEFACGYIKREDVVFDMCSGSGIIGLLVEIERGATVFGADIDEAACDMSNRSAALNGLGAKFYHADVRDVQAVCALVGKNRCDAVTVNPPFYKAGSRPSKVSPQASSEISVTFADIAAAARSLLKPRGEFFAVHTTARLDEILCVCRTYGLIPKDLTINRNGKTFLLRCVSGGGDGLSVKIKG